MSDTARWLAWVRELQAMAQTGLHFARDPYDRERYERLQVMAAEMLACHSNLDQGRWLEIAREEFGYATPKVDVRAAVFREERILLVREVADEGRWTLPGGWADVNDAPSEAVTREVREESGFDVVVRRLVAVHDREKRGHAPPFPYHVYKMFFLCEITGGAARPNAEASEVAFFQETALPELSVSRVTEAQICSCFEFLRDPARPTEFD